MPGYKLARWSAYCRPLAPNNPSPLMNRLFRPTAFCRVTESMQGLQEPPNQAAAKESTRLESDAGCCKKHEPKFDQQCPHCRDQRMPFWASMQAGIDANNHTCPSKHGAMYRSSLHTRLSMQTRVEAGAEALRHAPRVLPLSSNAARRPPITSMVGSQGSSTSRSGLAWGKPRRGRT